ncbi:MAG: hypothetical protein US20_C0023G0005 [Candidatus Pacebacteria bacterium GW2011_GWF1_36_5]|nr:MAG: hypothetical protein US20_C0023G0005 [Candidatus Pacebacteria bacterium GW2011_GWF1_36_5]
MIIEINNFSPASPRLCTEIAFASYFKEQPSIVKDFTKWKGGNYGCYSGVIHIYLYGCSGGKPTKNGYLAYQDIELYVFKLSHNSGYENFKDLFNRITEIFKNNKYRKIEYTTYKIKE